MPFVKVQKDKAYFKRFQVAYRRRREGKTDYQARRALTIQDKNKYMSPKYRLVVRLTNHYVICQVVYAEIDGDRIMASANSKELIRYGVKVGLKNYTAAYLTGLLVARRLLVTLKMDGMYNGNEDPTGAVVKTEEGKRTFYVAAVDEERRPFRCYLDVGLRRTTTGSRVFGAMKGAVDGGLDIPHNEKRFPGYIREAKKFDADETRNRISGGHIKDYMEFLAEEDEESYEKRFVGYIKLGLDAENVEEMYEKAVTNIRLDPAAAVKKEFKFTTQYQKAAKSSLAERKARVAAKKADRVAKLSAALADDADMDEE